MCTIFLRYIFLVILLVRPGASGVVASELCAAISLERPVLPLPQDNNNWRRRLAAAQEHEEALRGGSWNIVFLGDSITKQWPMGLWNQYFAPLGSANLAIVGERVSSLLWRLDNGLLGNFEGVRQPRLVVLLIGVNDLRGNTSASEVASGVAEVVRRLGRRLPASRILLVGLPPAGDEPSSPLRARVMEINGLLAGCADRRRVWFVDVGAGLLDSAGHRDAAMIRSGIHPNEAGYRAIAEVLVPAVRGLIRR